LIGLNNNAFNLFLMLVVNY